MNRTLWVSTNGKKYDYIFIVYNNSCTNIYNICKPIVISTWKKFIPILYLSTYVWNLLLQKNTLNACVTELTFRILLVLNRKELSEFSYFDSIHTNILLIVKSNNAVVRACFTSKKTNAGIYLAVPYKMLTSHYTS